MVRYLAVGVDIELVFIMDGYLDKEGLSRSDYVGKALKFQFRREKVNEKRKLELAADPDEEGKEFQHGQDVLDLTQCGSD